MKFSVYTYFLFCPFFGYSQTNLQGYIKDSKTKEAIPYCAIGLKNTSLGCMTNEEGIFHISGRVETDTLIINYVGYKSKQLALNRFVKDPVIYIDCKEVTLREVVVTGNDDYLYEIVEKCRKDLFRSKQSESKIYYVLETEIADQPVELFECYYNGKFNNSRLKSLTFKNGRVGIAPYENRYFINLNTSKAFTFLDISSSNDLLPAIPLQYNKKKLGKYFRLSLKSVDDPENPLYNIVFTPIKKNGKYFGGEIWVEKNTGHLKKIILNILNTTHHPFLPVFKDYSEITSASMQITKTYAEHNKENMLSHIDFNYQLQYHHLHQTALSDPNSDTVFEVKSKGLMYFYDQGKPFIAPYFEYDSEISDYRKINTLTYNESFWNTNNGLVYSEKMKKGISYFKTNGQLINYRTRSYNSRGPAFKGDFVYENNYLAWSDKSRISLKKNGIRNDTVLKNSAYRQSFIADRYKIKAQLFLDLNPMKDSVQHYSATIFDVFETYYNIAEEPFTNCFLNIYFDLFEIERRKMEKVISKNKFTVAQFDSLYKRSIKNLEEQTAEYINQVERGKNFKELEKWNYFVLENLSIDNIEIFQLKIKSTD